MADLTAIVDDAVRTERGRITWESTDWPAIVAAYDALAEVSPSPVVALNRAVAVSMLAGPSAGLAALKALERPLADYHLFYATRADMLRPNMSDMKGTRAFAVGASRSLGNEETRNTRKGISR